MKALTRFILLAASLGAVSAQPSDTWTDPATKLMWAKQDNGSDVNWYQATAYCRNLSLAGYRDWRLPISDELFAIEDRKVDAPGTLSGKTFNYHVKGGIRLSGGSWSSEKNNAGNAALAYGFANGTTTENLYTTALEFGTSWRALCVRQSGGQASVSTAPTGPPAPTGPTWTDPATKLIWPTQDNGSDLGGNQAIAYCRNLNLGGYQGWRVPDLSELQSIYDPNVTVMGTTDGNALVGIAGGPRQYHIKGNIHLTSIKLWSATRVNRSTAYLGDFSNGNGSSTATLDGSSWGILYRVLCVHRSVE